MFRLIHRTVLALVGLALPFEWLNVRVAGFPITPNKVLTALLVVVVAAQWTMEGGKIQRDRKLPWAFLLGVSVAVSTVVALLKGFPLAVLAITATWVFLLIFYVVLTFTIKTEKDLEVLLTALAIGAIAVVVVSAMGSGFHTHAAQGSRLGGEGGNPNQLGYNLICALPVALALMMNSRSRFWQLVFLTSAAVSIAGLVATLSRSAYLAVAAMGVFWMFRFRRFDLLRYAVPFVGIVAIAFYFAPPAVFARIATIDPHHLDHSATTRIQALPPIWAAIKSHPFIGIGLGTFAEFTYSTSSTYHGVVHNMFLHVASEQGLLGLIPYAALVFLSWVDLSRCWRISRRLRYLQDGELGRLGQLAAILQISLAGMLVSGLFQPSSKHKAVWLVLSVSTVLYALVRNRVAVLDPDLAARSFSRSRRRRTPQHVPASASFTG